jgi:hypothetical protein
LLLLLLLRLLLLLLSLLLLSLLLLSLLLLPVCVLLLLLQVRPTATLALTLALLLLVLRLQKSRTPGVLASGNPALRPSGAGCASGALPWEGGLLALLGISSSDPTLVLRLLLHIRGPVSICSGQSLLGFGVEPSVHTVYCCSCRWRSCGPALCRSLAADASCRLLLPGVNPCLRPRATADLLGWATRGDRHDGRYVVSKPARPARPARPYNKLINNHSQPN